MGNGLEAHIDPPKEKQEARLMNDNEVAGTQAQRERPVFAVMTPAKVMDVVFKEVGRQPKGEDIEIKVTIAISMELEKPTESGTRDVLTNYAVRLFKKKDGSQVLYWGKTTDATKVRDLVADAVGIDKMMDLITFKKHLVGKTVFVKSEDRNNPTDNTTVSKAIIKQIKIG